MLLGGSTPELETTCSLEKTLGVNVECNCFDYQLGDHLCSIATTYLMRALQFNLTISLRSNSLSNVNTSSLPIFGQNVVNLPYFNLKTLTKKSHQMFAFHDVLSRVNTHYTIKGPPHIWSRL